MDWIVTLHSSYIEALTLNMTVVKDKTSKLKC